MDSATRTERSARALARWTLAFLCAAAPARAAAGPPPWQRTETRADCASFDPLRQPYFGDTHVHTGLSFDAVTGGVVTGPRDAYEFAKGAPIALPPYDAMGVPQRSAQLRRPLDFTAITDHSEMFGEVQICLTPELQGYDDPICQSWRSSIPQNDPGVGGFSFFANPYITAVVPQRHPFCGSDGSNCLGEASLVWQDIQAAAEEKYDRTAACTFTSFVAYEWSRTPNAQNMHRNVIFRNALVPPLPISAVDQTTPQGLWSALRSACLDGLPGCDVLAIPHNSNLSNGQLFIPENADGSPLTAADASERAAMEPLVEIQQHKGDSECRPGVLTTDELCGFEKMTSTLIGVSSGGTITYDPRLFVRNALKEGLQVEESIGVNPFRLGILAATDTHSSTPGDVDERDFGTNGHLGTRDATPAFILADPLIAPLAGIEGNGGGLAVVWAEENSRDAIFSAMRRREVYGTSGTRPIVRFFAGDYATDLCQSANFVETGYQRGVPMGGEIGAIHAGRSPAFAVLAMKDPGGGNATAAPLQRVQIVKGWVNSTGSTSEHVYDVAGAAANGATVDPATCTASGPGFDTLCTVWEDPDFHPEQRAFYYARVVENPMCRWSTYLCNAQGVDCSNPGSIPSGLEECCNANVPRTIQERAWTSPIWYRPEAFAKFNAAIHRHGAGRDTLRVSARLHKVPAELDPDTNPITLTVQDDDVIYTATIPPGTMSHRAPGHWVLSDRTGANAGIRKAVLRISGNGRALLTLKAARTDLSHADLTDHFVRTTLQASSFTAEHVRLWQAQGTALRPQT